MFFKKTVLVIGFDATTVDFLVEHKRLTKIGVKIIQELGGSHDTKKVKEAEYLRQYLG